MSFINLMASDVWSAADIDNRVQSMIRSRFSAQDELKAARLARKPDATEGEAAFVASVDAWIAECIEQGHQARVDMVLLHEVLGLEVNRRRLAQPVVEPELSVAEEGEDALVLNQDALDLDAQERTAAEFALQAGSQDALDLLAVRNPEPEPEPVVENLEPEVLVDLA